MLELLTPAEMKAVDDYAIRQLGIPGVALMESAGAKVVQVIEQIFQQEPSRNAVVLCGKGNNGGDGSVVARRLMCKGWQVALVLAADPEQLLGDARVFWEAAGRSGVPCYVYEGGDTARAAQSGQPDLCLTDALRSSSLIVDALLGTGARLAPEGAVRQAIDLANRSGTPIVSVDVPSGIDCTTGQIPGTCISARDTVTFCRPKIGMMQYPAAKACGRLWVADIGIPDVAIAAVTPTAQVITRGVALDALPVREPWSHKGDAGRALILAGSARYPGAAHLCATACLRGGAGLVTAVAPGAVWPVLAAKFSEVMLVPAGEPDQTTFGANDLDSLGQLMRVAMAICVGPGITTAEEPRQFLAAMLAMAQQPVVLDADALTLLAASDEVRAAFFDLAGRTTPILTPHAGEAARLLGSTADQVQADRMTAARRLASEYQCVVVLKGARTIVSYADRLWVNVTGNPGLATGGTGDVLAGLITSFLAQGASAVDAACAGVFVHGLSADIVARRSGVQGMTAGDVAQMIPQAIAVVARGNSHLLEYATHV